MSAASEVPRQEVSRLVSPTKTNRLAFVTLRDIRAVLVETVRHGGWTEALRAAVMGRPDPRLA